MNFILLDRDKQIHWKIDPDALQWFKQNPPAEFSFVSVGDIDTFVKRQPNMFPGWGLLVSAISDKQVINSARILSICHDEKNYYYFSERLRGQTLEQTQKISNGSLSKRTLGLQIFDAIHDVNRRGYWFADLCAKNVFVCSDGYHLIDLDSALPHSSSIRPGLPISYEHKMLLVEFASKRMLKSDFNFVSIGGECINQAEIISFAMDISQGLKIPSVKRKEVTHALLERPETIKLYHSLFNKLVRNIPDWPLTRCLVQTVL